MLIDIIFFSVASLIVYLLYKSKFSKKKQVIKQRPQEQKPLNQRNQQNQPQQRGWNRRRQNRQDQQNSDNGSEQSDEEKKNYTQAEGRKAAKKQQKARLKKQRQQQIQESTKLSNQKYESYRKRQQQQQKAQQQKQRKIKEAMDQIAQQDRKKKQQQYNKWKDFFVVQNSGHDQKSAEEIQAQKKVFNEKFLMHIKSEKICLLEDLANEFKISTKEVVEKIKQFETLGKINGVFDERGKYLQVTDKEWLSIISYMKAKGRVTKADMMLECANIIKFQGEKKSEDELLKLIEESVQEK